jgi:hypothetical protein
MTDDQWERIRSLAKKFFALAKHNTELFTLYDQIYEGYFNEKIREAVIKKLEKLQSTELRECIEDLITMSALESAGTFGYIKALQDVNK